MKQASSSESGAISLKVPIQVVKIVFLPWHIVLPGKAADIWEGNCCGWTGRSATIADVMFQGNSRTLY